MPGGRKPSYRNTGPGEKTLVASLDLDGCKGNITLPKRNIHWRGAARPVITAAQKKAAWIYAYGTVNEEHPCTRCVKGSGPFDRCVVAFDNNGYIANGVCANCHWLHRTDVCTCRHTLPCEALANAGSDLGVWAEACKVSCNGLHVGVSNVLSAAAAATSASASAAATSAAAGAN